MNHCDRCRKVLVPCPKARRRGCPARDTEAGCPFDHGTEDEGLMMKDSILGGFGDAMSLCSECGKSCVALFEAWLKAGEPEWYRCGCEGRTRQLEWHAKFPFKAPEWMSKDEASKSKDRRANDIAMLQQGVEECGRAGHAEWKKYRRGLK